MALLACFLLAAVLTVAADLLALFIATRDCPAIRWAIFRKANAEPEIWVIRGWACVLLTCVLRAAWELC